jgi:hypothetical protein
MLFAILPLTLISVTSLRNESTFTIKLPFFEPSIVSAAFSLLQTFALSHSIHPLAFIRFILVDQQLSKAMELVILETAFIPLPFFKVVDS